MEAPALWERCVFITGGTGFVGKVLVEKLLRSCPEIETIYLLMRPKRGQDVAARLNDLLNSTIFDTIRREKIHELKKIVPICGDVTLIQLGISESDQELLCRRVSVVYHLAATIKFDEQLKLAVKINMLGTRSLLELCHRMVHLDVITSGFNSYRWGMLITQFSQALVHVSTAYCNCDRSEIQEVIYPPPYDPANIISLVDWLPEDILDKLTPSLIGQRPNTYTFTKALTEQMILKEAGSLPVAIVRPSILIACYNEPTLGWLHGYSGPNFLTAAIGNGLLHTVFCQGDFISDVIPVDFVSSMMITAAWRTATARTRDIKVFNCVNGNRQPITWQEFVTRSITYMVEHPMEGAIWYPTTVLHTNRFTHATLHYLVHYLPAYVLDFISWSMGKRQILVKTQKQLTKAAQILEYFTTRQWHFTDDNVRELLTHMSSTDRTTFQFDVTQINWNSFFQPYALGLRTFLLKQNPKSLPKSRRKMARGIPIKDLAFTYNKSKTTISRWIKSYEKTRDVARKKSSMAAYRKFNVDQRTWLVNLYKERPILHQYEAARLFFDKFQSQISTSSIGTILSDAGLTWKVLERRAIQIQLEDILRFANELCSFPWLLENLVFLDEVGFDNKDMMRKRGYALKGQKLIYRSEFVRKPRISLLCFIGVNGMLECFQTEGTFTRLKFVNFCRSFATSVNSKVQQYPGKHSVWIMDGAKIHLDKNFIMYLRSLGIIVVFLPAYCPFFNPIEIVFGLMKRELTAKYIENSKIDIKMFIGDVVNHFSNKNLKNIFKKCGYLTPGKFDQSLAFDADFEVMGYSQQ
ncbi:hypothetical protein HA402_001537 [Bradysia odoriphaga]|nr:hypothetical protein HA402_001537 [Bradysia odoriphaga]